MGSSPHTRDKYHLEFIQRNRIRIIPAYAGQITGLDDDGGSAQDHPRIRGTNPLLHHIARRYLGSSPHTRDKL